VGERLANGRLITAKKARVMSIGGTTSPKAAFQTLFGTYVYYNSNDNLMGDIGG
jgi:hypothetical protein